MKKSAMVAGSAGKIWGKRLVIASLVALATQLPAYADDGSVSGAEAETLIKLDEQPAAIGDSSLGDTVDMHTGSVVFSQTDLSIPGNSKLPVAVVRRLDPARKRSLGETVPGAFYTWDLDLPRITTTLAKDAPWPNDRCSNFWYPTTVRGSGGTHPPSFSAGQYWSGYKIEFSGGSALMLQPSANAFPKPASFATIAADNIGITCTTATVPGGQSAGEGYTVWLPDGTHYDFTLLITQPALSLIIDAPDGGGGSRVELGRTITSLMATKVTDRFGNYVSYNYDSAGHIKTIAANDGRKLTFTWTAVDSYSTVVTSVTDGTRTWQYNYNGQDLTSVTRPDHSQWQFSMKALANVRPGEEEKSTYLPATGSITSPYGLTGVFNLDEEYHGQAGVPCGSNWPSSYFTAGLTSKTLSGPGIATETWSYSYLSVPGYHVTSQEPYCPTPSNTDSEEQTTVLAPDGVRTVYSYNVNFDWREGNLDEVDVYPKGATVPIQTTTYSYASLPQIGNSTVPYRNNARDANAWYRTGTTISVNGDTYTNQVQAIDAYKNPTQITRSNSFSSNSRTEVPSYQNSATASLWVIGAGTGVTVGGTQVSKTSLNSLLMPENQFSYGLKTSTTEYFYFGLPITVADGLGQTTSFASYYRGTAQTITRADSTVLGKTVNASGTVATVTDARTNTTTLSYDDLNRLKQVIYPTGDTVNWAPTNLTYVTLTAPELGIPAGSLRVRAVTGKMQRSTYYDAKLQPVLVEEQDTSTGEVRYTASAYDVYGRVIYQSYPASVPSAATGINLYYDALGRLTSKQSTDGTVLQKIAYLAGNQKKITDANSHSTTITYQAFDKPAYDAPVEVDAPTGQTTILSRDVYGHLLSATQSGTYMGNPISETRSYVYDSHYRLCKTIDPETGQTVIGYDNANNITWKAINVSGPLTGCNIQSNIPATKLITYNYDTLNRIKNDIYPAGTDSTAYDYDQDGHLKTITTPTVAWTYGYDNRGLLETQTAVVQNGGSSTTYVIQDTPDPLAHLSQRSYPDGKNIAYAPNAWGEPTKVGSYAQGVDYWPSGAIKDFTYGNGLSYSQTLDSRQRPRRVTVPGMLDLTYGYDDENNLLSIADANTGNQRSLGYDLLNRLSTASGVWGSTIYSYDPLNNLRSQTTGGQALKSTWNATTNRVDGLTGTVTRSYQYDSQANLSSDGIHSYTFDVANRLVQTTGIATYQYDGHNRRTVMQKAGSTETSIYSIDGELVYTFNTSGNVATDYISLGGEPLVQAGSGKITYLHVDVLGSPVAASSSTGAWLWYEQYQPYGMKQSGVSEKLGFTHQVFDPDTGLTDMKARLYDPMSGRFLSTDPHNFLDSNPYSFNRYAYANNNPESVIDPTGMDASPATEPVSQTWGDPRTGTHIQGGLLDDNGRLTFSATIRGGMSQALAPLKEAFQGAAQAGRTEGPKMLAEAAGAAGDALTAASLLTPEGDVAEAGAIASKVVAPVAKEAGEAVIDELVQFHHAFPKYLGGSEDQLLEPVFKSLHDTYHSGLDKYLPRSKTAEYYAKQVGEARANTLRTLGSYTKSFDAKYGTNFYDAMVREGFTPPP